MIICSVDNCPQCGGATEPIVWSGETGVVSPDGVCETWTVSGWLCLDCGAIEPD